MAEFNLRTYNVTLLRLYKKDKEEISRLLEDLEYYMLETKDKTKYLYILAANKFDIYIVWDKSKTEWTHDKVSLIISNSLKKSTFMHLYLNGYNGLMNTEFWDELKDSVQYFSNTKKFRKNLKKKESEESIINNDIQLTIDDVLNKINDSGIDSLTDEEKQILKNQDDEDNLTNK